MRRLSGGLTPQVIKTTGEKNRNSPLYRGGLFLKVLFARREKEDEFCVGECLQLFDGIVEVE